MAQAVFIRMHEFLAGAGYPATRGQLTRCARAQGADRETLTALSRIPDRVYATPAQVSQAVAYSGLEPARASLPPRPRR